MRIIDADALYCGNCDKTDGLCYTSLPPKVKCTITGEYHLYSDKCTVKQQSIADVRDIGANLIKERI